MSTSEGDRVHCTECGRENRPDSRYCSGCGIALTRQCANCARELAADARFCDGCGTPVAADEMPATPADTAARKTVTALFCDLVGSTAFGEKVDAESAREAMARYRRMAQAAIEDNGGEVAKFIGDGVMALWGVDEVSEDDAYRAVQAGSALQDGFAEIEDHIRNRYDVEVGLRVGINTGEVVIAEDDDDIVGDALNTAARLEAAATPGRVFVGEATYRLTRHQLDYADAVEIEAKGKDEPVTAYAALFDTAVVETVTPFVGRAAELTRLRQVLEDTILQRRAHMVSVVGSPGVGKTRLAQELRADVEGGVRAFELRCEPSGDSTFAPIADLLRSVADLRDEWSSTEIVSALGEVVASLGDDADRVAELLAGIVGAAPMRSTEEVFLAVRRLLEVLGESDPVVLVVDDIQWAEPLFLDLLEHLAEWVQSVPLLLVALARPEIREVRASFAEEGRRLAAVVSLEGLDADTTGELAARLLDTDELPDGLLDRIPQSTEGNPLFVREVVRMLVDDGVISNASGRWELMIDLEAVEVPPTVTALLASRVDRMSTAERRILEIASVIGSEFPVGALADIHDLPRRDLDVALERMRRKELVEPTGAYLGNEPVFRFHHVLIREAAYRRLLKGSRAELHQAVGEWTERAATSLVGEFEVAIATHFEQAHVYRLELDLDDEETAALGARAAVLFEFAATRALEREDLEAAGGLASRALSVLSDTDAQVPHLLLTGCEALLSIGRVADAQPLIDRLAEVAEGDDRLSAWHVCFAAERAVLADPGGVADAERQVAEAAETLAALDDTIGVAKARWVRAISLVRLGKVGECETELDLALAAARAADDRRRVTAVLGAAPVAALWGPSPVPRAGGRCLDVIRLLRITTGSPAVEATSVRCQGLLEALRGRFDTARTMLGQARATVEELGLGHGVNQVDLYLGIAELLAGEPGAAEPHLRSAHRGLGQLGIGADAGQAAAYLARALLLQGRLHEAEDLVHQADALAGQNQQTAIVVRAVHAEVLSAQGAHDEAMALADEAVARAAASDILFDHANAVASQARVRAAAGDAEGAARSAASAAALYEQKGATVAIETASPNPDRPTAGSPIRPAPIQAPPLQPITQLALSVFFTTPDEHAANVAPDFDILDNRSLIGSGRMNRAEYLAWHRELDLAEAGFRPQFDELEVWDDRLTIANVSVDGPEGETYRWIGIARIDDSGRLDRTRMYDADQLPEAREEFERLKGRAAVAEFWNRADRFAADMTGLLTSPGDRSDEWFELVTEDAVAADLRPTVGATADGRDEFRALFGMSIAAPWTSIAVETVAVRGDDLILLRARMALDNAEYDLLTLNRYAPDGRLTLYYVYDASQLHQALRELDRLHATTLPPFERALFDAMARLGLESASPSDVGAVLPLMHPVDFRNVNRRAVSFPDDPLEDYIERQQSVAAVGVVGALAQSSRIHRMSPAGSVIRFRLVIDPGGTEQWIDQIQVSLTTPTGFCIERVEFDLDHLDEAIALYEEHEQTVGPWLANLAVLIGAQVNARSLADHPALRVDGASERNEELLSRLIIDRSRLDREPHAFGLLDRRTIAIRGEELALIRAVRDDGDVVWSLEEVDLDGRVVDWQLFEDGNEAADRLDERHFELDDANREPGAAFVSAFRALDAARLRASITDDFESVDHRRIGFGTMGTDGWEELLANLTDSPSTTIVQEHLERRGDVAVNRNIVLYPDGRGELFFLSVDRFAGGLVASTELFDLEDEDAVWERFRKLATGGHRSTLALRQVGYRAALRSARDFTGLRATFHPDFRFDVYRQLAYTASGGADQVIEHMRSSGEIGFDAPPGEIVAIRGDLLVLIRLITRTETGYETELLRLQEFHPDGRVVYAASYDPDDLVEALRELDRRHTRDWSAVDRFQFEHHVTRLALPGPYREAAEGLRTTPWAGLVSPDFVALDHRDLGFGEQSGEEFFARLEAGRDQWGAGFIDIVEDVPVFGPHGHVARSVLTGATDGRVMEIPYVQLAVMSADGQFGERQERFPHDQVDRAIERFSELTADRPRPVVNLAVQVGAWVSAGVRVGSSPEQMADFVAEGVDLTANPHGFAARRRPIAIRGDELALVEVELDESELAWSLEEVDLEGRLVGWALFKGEDAQIEALRRLDERHQVLHDITDAGATMIHALRTLDATLFEASTAEDLAMTDHRTLGFGAVTREGMSAMLDEGVMDFPIIVEHLAWTARASLVRSVSAWPEAGMAAPYLSAGSLRDGVVASVDLFDVEDEAAAWARFRELDAATFTPLDNAASLAARACVEPLQWGDGTASAAMVAPGGVFEDARSIATQDFQTVGPVETLAYIAEGRPNIDTTTLAIRGDHLALMHFRLTGAESEWEWLAVSRSDESDRLDLVVMMDPSALAAAMDRLDELWLEAEGIGMRADFEYDRALRAGDFDRLRGLAHPDFEIVDHRALGLLNEAAGKAAEWTGDQPWLIVSSEIVRWNELGKLHAVHAVEELDGSSWETTRAIAMLILRDGKIIRNEIFPEDQRAEAIARFEELTYFGGRLSNRATRLVGESVRRAVAGDLEGWNRTFADDIVISDHRPLLGAALQGENGVGEFHAASMQEAQHGNGDVLAIRGDELTMLTVRLGTADEHDISDYIVIQRINDDDRIDLVSFYETAQLQEAIEELDRLHMQALPTLERAQFRTSVAMPARLGRGDAAAAFSFLNPTTFRMIDQRPLGFPELDFDAYLDRVAMLDELAGSMVLVARRVIECTSFVTLVEYRTVLNAGQSDENHQDSLMLTLSDETLRPVLQIQYDLADEPAAIARAEEHLAQLPRVPVNAAVVIGMEVNALTRPLHPGLASTSEVEATKRRLAERVVEPERIGKEPNAFDLPERRVLAIRGDRLALVGGRRPDGSMVWCVEEVDEDGRLVDWRAFEDDRPRAAYVYLQDRDTEMSGRPRVLADDRYRDFDGFTALVHDEFRLVDHRRVGYGELGRDAFIDAVRRGLEGDAGPTDLIDVELLARTDDIALCWSALIHRELATDDPGRLHVYATVEGRLVLTEVFDVDDEPRAWARFRELGGDEQTPVAFAAIQRLTDAVTGARFDDFVRMWADDAVFFDRRPTIAADSHGRDAVVEHWRPYIERADVGPTRNEFELLATRGDRLALTAARIFEQGPDGTWNDAPVYSHVYLTRVDATGLIDIGATYELEQLHDAHDELDRLAYPVESEGMRAFRDEVIEQARLIREMRLVEAADRLAPGFTMRDTRPVGFGELDAEGFRERQRSAEEAVASGTIVFPTWDRFDMGVVCSTMMSHLQTHDGTEIEYGYPIVQAFDVINGGPIYVHQFDEDADIAEAIATADRLITERRQTMSFTDAVAVGGVASGRARWDTDAFLDLLADDFSATLLDGRVVTRTDVVSGDVPAETLGFGHVGRELVCSTDPTALLRVTSNDTTYFSLEIEENGRITEVVQHPSADLPAATSAQRDRHLATMRGAPGWRAAEIGHRYATAVVDRDPTANAAMLTDDFVVSDHRPLSYGTMSKAELIELLESIQDLPEQALVGDYVAVSPDGRGAVWRTAQYVRSGDSWIESSPGLIVTLNNGERISQMEIFPLDKIDEAVERMGALTAP